MEYVKGIILYSNCYSLVEHSTCTFGLLNFSEFSFQIGICKQNMALNCRNFQEKTEFEIYLFGLDVVAKRRLIFMVISR